MLAGLLGLSDQWVLVLSLSALVYLDGFPASRETPSSSVSVFGRGFLFFIAFPYEPIPKANFLAGSGGSGSGYGGGWDSVQRFDHGSCRIWVLGARELTQSLPEGCPSPSFWSLCGRHSLLEMWCGDISHPSPKFMQGPGVWVGLLQTVPAGPTPSKSVVSLSHPSCSFIFLSKEPSIFRGVGGDGGCCKDAASGMEHWHMMATSLS